MYRNKEGYPDETAGKAISNVDKLPNNIKDIIYILKTIASLAGFEIIGRIALKDKETGREWR